MIRAVVLALLVGCAATHVRYPSGLEISAVTLGQSRVEVRAACPDGTGDTVTVRGGKLSTSVVDLVGIAANAAVAWWTAGAVP